jgi:hypothetical protein
MGFGGGSATTQGFFFFRIFIFIKAIFVIGWILTIFISLREHCCNVQFERGDIANGVIV